jgi:hypothetical protein
MLDNPLRTRAAALNAVARAARGEILVPMDPAGDYARTHVSKCVAALSFTSADHVAIVPRTAGRTFVERALSAAQKTKLAFAAGAELARDAERAPAALGAVRRSVLERVGLFDPGAQVEEDDELSFRITRAGGAFTVQSDIVVHRADASSFRELFVRHYQLGRGRARRAVKERRLTSIHALGPLAIVLGGGVLAATSSVQPLTPFVVAAYALVTGRAALEVARTEGMITVPIAWAAYPVMHVAHGAGFGVGLVRALARPDWAAASPAGEPAPA